MSDPSVPAQSPLLGSAAFPASSPTPQYKLSDDLARLCLPQEFKDSHRRLAWVNSICALFLVVGLVGLKAPKVIVKPLSEITEPVPVIFTPPPQEVRPQQQVVEEKPDETTDQIVDTPQVMPVVAAADAPVAFSVPVQGTVMIAPQARLAPPPPPKLTAPPVGPVQFNPALAHEGSFPPPMYPNSALRNRETGTVMVEIKVDPSGKITSANIQKSSGHPDLDEAALSVVKHRWRFAPGGERWLVWPCVFQIQ